MKKYIGCKMIEAEPCKAWKNTDNNKIGDEGYKLRYPDGYESWSPKEVFEKAYMQVGDNVTITQDNVDNFIKSVDVITMGDKTTVVRVTLVNGFEIVESSSCVKKENYDEKYGAEICIEHIKNRIWHLLGFLLQTAVGGVKNDK